MEKTVNIILPLGNNIALETNTNEAIAIATATYNDAVKTARVDLANKLHRLPIEVGAKILTEVAAHEHELPVFTIINSGRRATLADARAIMKEDFISHHLMADIFRNRVNVPKLLETDVLPYTVALLERMTAIGAVLLYQPLTNTDNIVDLNFFAQLQKGLSAKPDGILLHREQFTEKGTVSSKAWFADKKTMCIVVSKKFVVMYGDLPSNMSYQLHQTKPLFRRLLSYVVTLKTLSAKD